MYRARPVSDSGLLSMKTPLRGLFSHFGWFSGEAPWKVQVIVSCFERCGYCQYLSANAIPLFKATQLYGHRVL